MTSLRSKLHENVKIEKIADPPTDRSPASCLSVEASWGFPRLIQIP